VAETALGMLPWENHLPGIDTSAHLVPGAWDVLIAELYLQEKISETD
jgi:hypothetical protein